LYESMLDGSHKQLDFPFETDGKMFEHLYYLVDGIFHACLVFCQQS